MNEPIRASVPNSSQEFLLWSENVWRCEYWLLDTGAEVRLYRQDALRRMHTVKGGLVEAIALASDWRTMILSDPR